MTMRECYEAIGGNYEAVLGRLHSEVLPNRIFSSHGTPFSFASRTPPVIISLIRSTFSRFASST